MLKIESSDRGCYVFTYTDDAGQIIAQDRFRPESANARTKFLKRTGLTDAELFKAVDEFKQAQQVEAGEQESDDFTLWMRGLYEQDGVATAYTDPDALVAFRNALAMTEYAQPEPVLRWNEGKQLAVLDIDYHVSKPPPVQDLFMLMERIEPKPRIGWISHGGGLHLIYTCDDILNADEAASLAALSFKCLDPGSTVEIKFETRHPAYSRNGANGTAKHYCSKPVEMLPDPGYGGVLAWLTRQADTPDVTEWLAEHGVEKGRGYDHSKCVIDPNRVSRHNTPVWVGDYGVYCASCEAYGFSHTKCSKPGFVPYQVLVPTPANPSLVRDAAANWCPWDHARYVMQQEFPVTESVARTAYRAILKLLHAPDDPRVKSCMSDTPFVRGFGGLWLHKDTLKPTARNIAFQTLDTFPFAINAWKDANGEWQKVPDARRREILNLTGSVPGWPELLPVRGIKLWGQFRPYESPGIRVVPSGRSISYVEPKARMPLTEAWKVIDKNFPGVNHEYLMLLLAARGFAESGGGPVPMIMATGPSGAAKTYTVHLAAELIGDVARPVKKADGKFSEQLGATLETAGFALIDEFVKAIKDSKPNADPRAAMNDYLLIDRNYSFRKLYVGPITMQCTSVIVLTDTSVPEAITADKQLGRRLVYVRLQSRVPRWEKTCGGDIHGWVSRESENKKAAEALVCHVIDEYFSAGSTLSFMDVAARLGFDALETSADASEGIDRDQLIRTFVHELCIAKPDPEATRWSGKGWKVIRNGESTPLTRAWEALHDEDDYFASRLMSESDLQQILRINTPVRFWTSKRNGTNTMAVRLTNTEKPQSAKFKVNEELFDADFTRGLGTDAGDKERPGGDSGVGSEESKESTGEPTTLDDNAKAAILGISRRDSPLSRNSITRLYN